MTDTNEAFVGSWQLALHDLSERSQVQYLSCLHLFLRWLAEDGRTTDLLEVTRQDVEGWFHAQAAAGTSANTRRSRWVALRSFYGWAHDEEEIDDNPMAKVKVARPDPPPPPVLPNSAVKALLKVCQGKGFAERRDLAIVRTFLATGARLAEVTALQVGDVDLQARVITITRGKGGKRRVVRIDAGTAAAVDRYRRARSRHRHAGLSALWVGQKGALTVSGLDAALHRRATDAGIDGFHAHLLRHWWADAWQTKGGNEGSLQVLGGWADASVMARYGAGRKVDRALAHYDEVNPLGDL